MINILFDLDNTLYDYDSAHKHAIHAVYEEVNRNHNISEEEFKKHYRNSKKEIKRELGGTAASHNRVLYFQRLFEKLNETIEPTKVLQLYRIYWDTLLDNAELLDGAEELLKFIKDRGMKIGVVTNLTAHIQIRKIEKLGISDLIDVLVTSEEAGEEKPDSSPFLIALHKLGSLASECIFVGDNPIADIEGAEALQMETIRIKFGSHADDVADTGYMIPDHTVDSLIEIKGIIEKLDK